MDNLHLDWKNWWRSQRLGGPRIQVAQPKYGSTAESWRMTDIPYYSYCYWLPSSRTLFSARWLGRDSRYVWNPPKVWI